MNLFIMMLLAAAASPHHSKHRTKVKARSSVIKPTETLSPQKIQEPVEPCFTWREQGSSLADLEALTVSLLGQGLSGETLIERVIRAIEKHKSIGLAARVSHHNLKSLQDIQQRLAELSASTSEQRLPKLSASTSEQRLPKLSASTSEQRLPDLSASTLEQKLDGSFMSHTDRGNIPLDNEDTADTESEVTGIPSTKSENLVDVLNRSSDAAIGRELADLTNKLQSKQHLYQNMLHHNSQDLALDLQNTVDSNVDGLNGLPDWSTSLESDEQPTMAQKNPAPDVHDDAMLSIDRDSSFVLPPTIPSMRQRFHTRSHGLGLISTASLQPNFPSKNLPSVKVKVLDPYLEKTYSIAVDLMPFMGVNDAFQQAYFEYSYRFPSENNPFDVQLLHLKSESCYFVKKVSLHNSVAQLNWFIEVFNSHHQPIYQGACIPSKSETVLKSGDVIQLMPIVEDTATDLD